MPYDPGPKPMQAPRARTADQAPPDRTPGLDDLLEVAGAGGTVILTFSNQVYLPILENWLTAMHRIGIDNILVVTLDEPTQRQMHTPGALCRLLLCEDDLSALWHRRVALFVAIVQRGYHLNNSDVDVVWLKDPRPEFQPRQRCRHRLLPRNPVADPLLERWHSSLLQSVLPACHGASSGIHAPLAGAWVGQRRRSGVVRSVAVKARHGMADPGAPQHSNAVRR